jgi:hypothetical protein
MALAIVTGKLWLMRPYISHNKVPKVNRAYMYKDIPEVSLVCMVLMAWGKNETVVPKAADKPIMLAISIRPLF